MVYILSVCYVTVYLTSINEPSTTWPIVHLFLYLEQSTPFLLFGMVFLAVGWIPIVAIACALLVSTLTWMQILRERRFYESTLVLIYVASIVHSAVVYNDNFTTNYAVTLLAPILYMRHAT